MNYELRYWRKEEYIEFYKYTRAESLQFYVFDSFPSTVKQCSDWVYRCCHHDTKQFFRVITVNGCIVGCIGIRVGDGLYRHSGELFFWVCKTSFACDFMPAVVRQFTDEMFRHYHLTRIYCRPLCSQPIAQCILKKAGYCLEGKMCSFVCIGDECQDGCLYALCRKIVTVDYCCGK